MSYDFHNQFHGDTNKFTGFNAPLFSNPSDPESQVVVKDYNVAAAVYEMLGLGVPRMKINAGLPFYGKGYSDVPEVNNGLFQTYKGPSL